MFVFILDLFIYFYVFIYVSMHSSCLFMYLVILLDYFAIFVSDDSCFYLLKFLYL